jgi:hypothetical protein
MPVVADALRQLRQQHTTSRARLARGTIRKWTNEKSVAMSRDDDAEMLSTGLCSRILSKAVFPSIECWRVATVGV